jgi:hypothetical protein
MSTYGGAGSASSLTRVLKHATFGASLPSLPYVLMRGRFRGAI